VRKSIALLVLLSSLVSVSNSEEQKLPEGFVLVETSSPYKMVLTPYATYPVVLEEYVPKVVLEGKWGTGPGEFSYEDYDDDEGMTQRLYPSMAVNSKGEIYILDIMNNRIQKFDADGKYLKSISVPTRADKNGKSIVHVSTIPYFVDHSFVTNTGKKYAYDEYKMCYRGRQILLDAQDNLFIYYWKGKGGEVWIFRDEIMQEKYGIKEQSTLSIDWDFGVPSIRNNNINISYDGINLSTKNKVSSFSKYKYKVEKINNDGTLYRVLSENNDEIEVNLPKKYAENIYMKNIFLINNGVRIYTTPWYPNNTYVIDYDRKGRVKGILCNPIEFMDGNLYYKKVYGKFGDGIGGGMGNNGNFYLIYSKESKGISVVVSEIGGILK